MIDERIKPILEADAVAYTKRLAGWPYAGVATAADVWTRRKYLFAKDIWQKREDLCPGFNCTWAARFEQMWHEPLAAYRARIREAREAKAA